MIAGYDKYFQIVRCFRDEDLRADRQPEFTQIDCEMSFVERDDVLAEFEGLICHLFKSVLDLEIPSPLPRMPYKKAMEQYGSDKPDIRFDMLIHDLLPRQEIRIRRFQKCRSCGAICAAVPPGHKKTTGRTYRMGQTAADRSLGAGLCTVFGRARRVRFIQIFRGQIF